ncbi:MAG: amidohydrolase family protein [Planctomycetes bacterium]|nr:amidohydrolase family protein [Planctomycetota bacterium]
MEITTRKKGEGWWRVLVFAILPGFGGTDFADEPLFFEKVTITSGDPARPQAAQAGSLLLSDGVIRRIALGDSAAAVQAPPGSRRIDGAGLYAYPAFIDAFTALGMRPEQPAPGRNAGAPPDFRDGPTPATPPALRSGIAPERDALDFFNPADGGLAAFRKAGFAAAHLFPSPGFLSGRTAVVSLSGSPVREAVIRAESGAAGSFSAPVSGYPSSLMGAIAHLRQTFLDARYAARLEGFYQENPLGLRRPPKDTALEAVRQILDRRRTLYFQADGRNDLLRFLRLAEDFQLEAAIAGGREAAKVASSLKKAKAPVVLLADYPEKPKISKEPGALPLRVQEERAARWRELARTAAALKEAGIPFAFGSGAKKDPEALVKSVRAAIEEGLPPPDALRALTLSAAEILGVERILGSIEEGKIANVAILDQPFADARAQLRYLVIDGKLFEFEAPKAKEEKSPEKPAEKPPEKPPEKTEKAPEKPEPPPDSGLLAESELEADRKPKLATGGDLFIKDAAVLTITHGAMPRASIRIRKGKIEAVGPEVAAEGIPNAIDASGWYVLPGIIDCHSHIAIDGGVNEFSESITCQVRIRDAVDPHDPAIYRALGGGVTAAHLLHGSANAIGGQCQLVKLKYGRTVEEMAVDWAPPTVKFALGENVKQSNFPSQVGNRFPVTRMGVAATLRRSFLQALDYERAWKEHTDRLSRGERSLEPRRDLRLEALLQVLRGELKVHSHCYRADEILMLLRTAEEFGFKVAALQHILEGYKVAPEIARHGTGASTFSDWWAYKIESYDAIPYNTALLARAGVVVSFNSDDPELIRHLHYEAAKGMKYGGLAEEEALKTITLNPARQLFASHRLGSIEPGKDADLAIFDAHPLSAYARCRYTIIEGEVYFETGGDRQNPNAGSRLAPPREFLPPEPPASPAGVYAVRGARLYPVDAEPIERGTVLIARGRIAALGPAESVAVPAEAAVIDGGGLEVYPGFIDAGSHLGLTEIGSIRGTVDLNETGQVQPDLRLASAVNVHSELIPATRANGITHAAIFNEGSLVAGQAAVIRLAGASTPEAVVREAAGLQVNVPGVERELKGEPQWVKDLKDWFRRARQYEEWKRSVSAGFAADSRLEALLPYARQELPVIFTADAEAQIRLAVKLAKELDVLAVIRGARDAWKVAPLLKENRVAVIAGPVLALPLEEFDPHDAPYRNAAKLFQAGVPFAFQSAGASQSRNLPYQAARAVAFGLPRHAAVRALTLGAAEILGLSVQTGSLTPGKSADLLVADGDPLEIATHVHYVFIAGKPVSLENRHTRLYRQFRERVWPVPVEKRERF